MARLSLAHNPKYKRLKRRLGLPDYAVRGILELLWESAHHNSPVFKSAADIEAACEWDGVAGVVSDALTNDPDGAFIDRRGDGLFEIHGYLEHAPHWVIERLRKQAQRATIRAGIDHRINGDSRLCPGNVPDMSRTSADAAHQAKPSQANIEEIYIPPTATALAAPCPLVSFPRLQKLYPGIREHLQGAHPKAKLPKVDSKQGIAERETLARLIRLDGYREGEVIHALRWVLKAGSDQADFWRSNFRAIGQLRKVKDGGTKFTKIFDAMQRDSDWPDVPPDPVVPIEAPPAECELLQDADQ